MSQRSPLIFWFLLAATISLDWIAYVWNSKWTHSQAYYSMFAYQALMLGQLSIVCIWSALSLNKTFWTRIAPLVVLAAMVGILEIGPLVNGRSMVALAYNGIYPVVLLGALWLLERTDFWRERSGQSTRWQFSLANVLLAMTIVALFVVAVRVLNLRQPAARYHIMIVSSSVSIAVASVVIWSLSLRWLIRLAWQFCVAILIAIGVSLVQVYSNHGTLNAIGLSLWAAYYLMQAIVLAVWLGTGYVLPLPAKSQINRDNRNDREDRRRGFRDADR
jgi:hypothetical protein